MQATLIVTIVLGAALAAQQPYTPARYSSGGRPALPALVVGGGEAFVELTVGPSGNVTRVTPLRSTPPFTDALAAIVRGWQFTAATEDTLDAGGKPEGPRPVESRVLAAALFRPPTLQTPTQGELPVNVATASAAVAYPTTTREPPYPPRARSGGVVLIEVRVSSAGRVTDARVIGSAPPFDQPALEAARQWRFRPARVGGRSIDSYAYLVFGFPEPITSR